LAEFKICGKNFEYNGKPIQIISGAVHYFRIVPEYWKDRLLKLKACGLNTVETYVPWNIHEPKPGQFNFQGMADIVRFIETAGELGLHVIVRPGPYICAEWEFGGFPAWLLADSDIRLRCYDPSYLEKVDRYFDALLSRLIPLQCTHGGPIIAMQVENEYGSYGNDKKYLEYLKEGMIKRGIDVLLFTSDGPMDEMLNGGTLPDVYKTVNFGSRPEEGFEKLLEFQPDKPLMCMEFWNGWFDHWSEPHHTREGKDAAEVLDKMLEMGASVNFYMFHGGTNFGFMNGANYYGGLQPTVTSYDYDAPISEAGELTEKYHLYRNVISKYVKVDDEILPEPIPKRAFGSLTFSKSAPLFDALDKLTKPIQRTCPESMEKLGQNYGFILYRNQVVGPRKENKLTIHDLHDRALIFLDGEFKGIMEGDQKEPMILDIPGSSAQLDILVENMGRINYGPHLKDYNYKGITEGVWLGTQFLFDWTIYPLPLDDLSGLQFTEGDPGDCPGFFQATLNIDEPADTFLSMEGWKKGVVFINGFNLGRYWEVGPTKTMYIPAPLLKKGENEIIIFELEGRKSLTALLTDKPDLG
jgi:beta-galactosidase